MLAFFKHKFTLLVVSTNLSEYHRNLRAALADFGTGGVYMWKDESLDGALLTVVQTGLGPAGVVVDSSLTGFSVAPATPDARGYLVFQSALLLVGGQTPVSFKTRAMAVNVNPVERAQTIDYLRRMIWRLENEGDPHGTGVASCFGVWTDLENALARSADPVRVVRTSEFVKVGGSWLSANG